MNDSICASRKCRVEFVFPKGMRTTCCAACGAYNNKNEASVRYKRAHALDVLTPPTLNPKVDSADPQAFKSDAGKPDFDLLMSGMPEALLDVVKVLSWAVAPGPLAEYPKGGKGYKPNSWKDVPEAKRRYRAAMQRHENAIARGEVNDPESGLPHRAHIATNALFLAQLEYAN